MDQFNHDNAEMEQGQTTPTTSAEAVVKMWQAGWPIPPQVAGLGAVTARHHTGVMLTWFSAFTEEQPAPMYLAGDPEDDLSVYVHGRCPRPDEVPALVEEHGVEDPVGIDPENLFVELD